MADLRLTFVLSCLFTLGVAKPFAVHYLDMTYMFNNVTVYGEGGQISQFRLDMRSQVLPGSDNVVYSGGDYMAREHGGTHMDAPFHFNLDGWKVGDIPVDRMRAPAVVIDIQEQVAEDPDYMATVDDFEQWESTHGRMPEDSVVMICVGWTQYWPDREKWYGTTNLTDLSTMHFPGVDPELAQWLIDNRKMIGMGTETDSVDGSATLSTVATHLALCQANMLILENVKDVCEIPSKGATLLMLPMKIQHGSGAPIRIIATWGDEAASETKTSCDSGAARVRTSIICCTIIVVLFY